MAAKTHSEVPMVLPETAADRAILAPTWRKIIPSKPAVAAFVLLGLLAAAPAHANQCDASAAMTLALSGSSANDYPCNQSETRSYGSGPIRPFEPIPPIPPIGTSHCGLAQVRDSSGSYTWQMACR